MTDQDKEYLRDLMAMFAMNGILGMLKGGSEGLVTVQESVSKYSYELADAMIEARKSKPEEEGILAIKPTKKTTRKV
jgi:hypothetical protein